MPELYDARDYLHEIADAYALEVCKDHCTFLEYPCDEDVYHLCNIIMEEQALLKSNDPFNMLDLYIRLRNEINRLLNPK